jgi:hypothetical protein
MAWSRTLGALFVLAWITPAHADEPGDPWMGPAAGMATRYHDALPWQGVTVPRALRQEERLTCAQGCTLTLHDNSKVVLSSGAVVAATSPMFQRFDGEEMARRCLTLRVLDGDVVVQRAPTSFLPLVLVAPSGDLVAVRTGRAMVRAVVDRVAVINLGGVSQAKRGGDWVALAPDLAHTVSRRRVTPRPIVATPQFDSSGAEHRPIALAARGPLGTVSLSWDRAGAALYHVSIASDAAFADSVAELTVSTPTFSHALTEGRYHVRVVAEDVDGIRAPVSAAHALRVLRVALPTGGFMPDDSTVVAHEDERIRLLDGDDVEISFNGRGFFRGVHELAIAGRDRIPIALRIVDQPQTATAFTLEKRGLHARVSLTPRLPSWPADTISAEVRLDDPSGHTNTLDVMPDLEVRVAGTVVNAHWERQGGTFRALIAGRDLDGPSLVEVFARDEAGKWLGWGFVEVLATR